MRCAFRLLRSVLICFLRVCSLQRTHVPFPMLPHVVMCLVRIPNTNMECVRGEVRRKHECDSYVSSSVSVAHESVYT